MRNVYDSKTFNKFQILERSQYFPVSLKEKDSFLIKLLKESRVAIASVEKLGNHSSTLQVIILCFIT